MTQTRTLTPTRSRTPSRTTTFTRTQGPTPTPSRTPLTIGPEVTFLGIVGAASRRPIPEIGREPGTNAPIYHWPNPFGFFIAVEFRPGESRRPVGQSTFNHSPNNPGVLPDLQIKSDHDLGIPTLAVCDAPPNSMVGGVPRLTEDGFGGSQFAANAINDLSCRFDVRVSSAEACTFNNQSIPSYVMNQLPIVSTIQFCTTLGVGSELAFPTGSRTRITVRGRDTLGQPGPAKSMIIEIE